MRRLVSHRLVSWRYLRLLQTIFLKQDQMTELMYTSSFFNVRLLNRSQDLR